jgi:hypothetical protein
MLAPADVERIARHLVKAGLSSETCFTVGYAVAAAILEPATTSRDAASPGGAAPKRCRTRGHSVDKSGALAARAMVILEEQPDISLPELASLAECSVQTARRVKTAFREPTPNDKPAVTFLRDVLAQGPQPAGQVEEQARARGLGPRQLDQARGLLGVTVQRLGEGKGVCYALPVAGTAAAENNGARTA